MSRPQKPAQRNLPRSRLDEVLRTGAAAFAESALPALSLNKTTRAPTYTEPTPTRGFDQPTDDWVPPWKEHEEEVIKDDLSRSEVTTLPEQPAYENDDQFDSLLGIKSIAATSEHVGTGFKEDKDGNKIIELKANTGTLKLWRQLSKGNVEFMTRPPNTKMGDLNYFLEEMYETETPEAKPVEMFLDTWAGPEEVLSLAPPHPLVFTSYGGKSEPAPSMGFTIGIKLWGFAGLASLSMDACYAYMQAVDMLLPQIKATFEAHHKTKGTMNKSKKYEGCIAIRFDGDPMVEKRKDGKKPQKFTHALFAPLVARRLKAHFDEDKAKGNGAPHIALVITKVEGSKETKEDFIKKFLDVRVSDVKGLFGTLKDHTQYFLRTDVRKSYFADAVNGQPNKTPLHSYPGVDLDTFDSISLVCARSDTDHEDPKAMKSEVKNQLLFSNYILRQHKGWNAPETNPVVKDFCICLGGNTVNGATSWINFTGKYNLGGSKRVKAIVNGFDGVVRRIMYASPSFVPKMENVDIAEQNM